MIKLPVARVLRAWFFLRFYVYFAVKLVVSNQTYFCPRMFVLEWRQEELERINNSLHGAERKAALCMLLDQETQLIAAIGRHKIEAEGDNKEKRIQDFLDLVSRIDPR